MPFEVLSQEVEQQVFVDLLVVLLLLVYLEDQTAALRVFRMFPFGLNVPLEEVNSIDFLPLPPDFITRLKKAYEMV